MTIPKELTVAGDGRPSSKSEKFVVYAICHPVTKTPFYVGETCKLKRRERRHLDGVNSTAHVRAAVRAIRQETGENPVFEALAGASSRKEAKATERVWIRELANQGCLLINRQGLRGTPLYRRARKRAQSTPSNQPGARPRPRQLALFRPSNRGTSLPLPADASKQGA